jgi:hypothetical protein
MKKVIISILLIIASVTTINLSAQVPPPPPSEHGATGNQTTGGAPIGSGIFILLGLGAVYGGKKIYDMKKKKLDE